MFARLVSAVVVAVCVHASVRAQSPAGLPIEVVNPTSSPMVRTPVTLGVPVPRWPFLVSRFEDFSITVFDAVGEAVPSQYRALSRWDGERDDASKSLKWAQVTFLADCPPNGTATYYMRHGSRPSGNLVLNETGTEFFISPRHGTAFVISKQTFNVFRNAVVEGEPVILTPGGSLRVVDPTGTTLSVQVTETVAEEVGSVRAVIRQKGSIGDLHYTCRWYFHAGQSEVTVDFRLENHNAYGEFYGITPGTRYFDSLEIEVPIAGATTAVTSSLAVHDAVAQRYELNQSFSMTQPQNLHANFSFDERLGPATVGAGDRYDGAVDVCGPTAGVTVAVDRFWENYPKAFAVENGKLVIGLWPEWGHGPEFRGRYGSPTSSEPVDPLALTNYRFEGGRWKTHRMVFSFHCGDRNSAEVAAIAERTNRPPAARPPAWWVKETGAVSAMIFSEKRPWTETSIQRFERQCDMIAEDSAADLIHGMRVGFNKFRQLGGTFGGRNFYGWDSYGDIIWAGGASSLHYDWPMSVLLNWYRGGSYGFFDVGRDMAWHRRDYDQNHTTDVTEPWRGAAFYEKGWWHGNFRFGEPSHSWAHGVLLHYAMTGEEASFEAANEMLNFLLRRSPRHWNGKYGTRIPGWTILNLVDSYNYLGVQAAIIEAKAGIDTWTTYEGLSGGNGFALNPMSQTGSLPASCKPWQHSIFFHGAARYFLSTGDQTVLPVLHRLKTWIANEGYIAPTGTPSARTVPACHSSWAPNGYSAGISTHHPWYTLDTLSYAYAIFGDPQDLDQATLLYETLNRFHQASPSLILDLNDPASYSKISVRMSRYPNTESKILGAILRWGQAYAAVRTWEDGSYFHAGH